MYSIIECGGFQFKVTEGDEILVPLMEAAKDAEVTLDRVLMAVDGEKTTVGTPVLRGASVKARVVAHVKGKKVTIMKKHKRKDYRRKTGHRQQYTKLKIVSIQI